MESLFFHPKLVHVPMALAVLMPLITGGLLVAWWRAWLPPRAWIVALGLQAILVVSGVAALRSGEAEEERVEPIVAESLIERHEEAAEVFVWGSAGVLGLMGLALAFASRRTPALGAAAAATVGTLVVFGLGVRTGQAGGDLVYRHGAAQAYVDAPAAGSAPERDPARGPAPGKRDDDDD